MLGYIGCSTGDIKIPLLVNNVRSRGGPGLLDNCIVGIMDRPKHFLYQHPAFYLGVWTTGAARSESYAEAAYYNGEPYAQFHRWGQAALYCAFMRGEQFSK